jgi:hypothetical protein
MVPKQRLVRSTTASVEIAPLTSSATAKEVVSGHASPISHPREVARLILAAAGAEYRSNPLRSPGDTCGGASPTPNIVVITGTAQLSDGEAAPHEHAHRDLVVQTARGVGR